MSGNYLLDTNAVIALLDGNVGIQTALREASWVGISVITELEFLSFSRLSTKDQALFRSFLSRVTRVGLSPLDRTLIQKTIELRTDYGIKLPDAIIAATALERDAILMSNDRVYARVELLPVFRF